MRQLFVALALCGGCIVEHQDPIGAPDPGPVVGSDPRTCTAEYTLDGTLDITPTLVGPMTLDANGTDLCLSIDTTKLGGLHFQAVTDYQPGDASGVVTTLEDGTFTTIVDGWDVTVDDSPPRTMSNLEWTPPDGTVTDVIVWVRAQSRTMTSTLNIALYEALPD